jgi:plastocyanin domain-containing protein
MTRLESVSITRPGQRPVSDVSSRTVSPSAPIAKPENLELRIELPVGQTVPPEFLPREPGEFGFACPMGMFRGRLIVE